MTGGQIRIDNESDSEHLGFTREEKGQTGLINQAYYIYCFWK